MIGNQPTSSLNTPLGGSDPTPKAPKAIAPGLGTLGGPTRSTNLTATSPEVTADLNGLDAAITQKENIVAGKDAQLAQMMNDQRQERAASEASMRGMATQQANTSGVDQATENLQAANLNRDLTAEANTKDNEMAIEQGKRQDEAANDLAGLFVRQDEIFKDEYNTIISTVDLTTDEGVAAAQAAAEKAGYGELGLTALIDQAWRLKVDDATTNMNIWWDNNSMAWFDETTGEEFPIKDMITKAPGFMGAMEDLWAAQGKGLNGTLDINNPDHLEWVKKQVKNNEWTDADEKRRQWNKNANLYFANNPMMDTEANRAIMANYGFITSMGYSFTFTNGGMQMVDASGNTMVDLDDRRIDVDGSLAYKDNPDGTVTITDNDSTTGDKTYKQNDDGTWVNVDDENEILDDNAFFTEGYLTEEEKSEARKQETREKYGDLDGLSSPADQVEYIESEDFDPTSDYVDKIIKELQIIDNVIPEDVKSRLLANPDTRGRVLATMKPTSFDVPDGQDGSKSSDRAYVPALDDKLKGDTFKYNGKAYMMAVPGKGITYSRKRVGADAKSYGTEYILIDIETGEQVRIFARAKRGKDSDIKARKDITLKSMAVVLATHGLVDPRTDDGSPFNGGNMKTIYVHE